MRTEDERFELPEKIDRYLATLSRRYEKENNAILRDIVVNGVVSIRKDWTSDNWSYGHALTLTLQEDLFLEIMEETEEVRSQICTDINKLDNTQGEYIDEVFIEMDPVEGDQWRENSGILRPRMAVSSIPSDALSRIWGDQYVRVFLSHKATFKVQTSDLKQALARYGISCFVAHEDIEPTEEWQREIERALFSMDALVALLTEDYHDSNWTDQEAGVAIGRGVPLIAVRLGSDPYGLMGKGQALGGCDWADIEGMASKIFDVLYKCLPDNSQLFKAALSEYSSSTSWDDSAWKVKHVLGKFESLTKTQVEQFMHAYRNNHENRGSFAGNKHLEPLLEKWTGKQWKVANNELVLADKVKPPMEGVPF